MESFSPLHRVRGGHYVHPEARWMELQWIQLLMAFRWTSEGTWIDAGHFPSIDVVAESCGALFRRRMRSILRTSGQ